MPEINYLCYNSYHLLQQENIMSYSVEKQWVYGIKLNDQQAELVYDLFKEQNDDGQYYLSDNDEFFVTLLANNANGYVGSLVYQHDHEHIFGVVFAENKKESHCVPDDIRSFFDTTVSSFLKQHNIYGTGQIHLVIQTC